MRKIEINYNNTENLVNNLRTILDGLDDEQRNVKQALGEIYDLENYYRNRNEIIDELEFRERKIHDDIRNTEELIKSIESFSMNVQETDERLAHKFKQDIKSYAKQNNIELVSEFDKWLDKAQMALDGLGLIPVVGEVADVINGVIYLAKGDIKNAGISFISMIPEVGDTAKGIRYFDKASDLLKLGDKVVDLEKSSKKIAKATDKFGLINSKINTSFKQTYKKIRSSLYNPEFVTPEGFRISAFSEERAFENSIMYIKSTKGRSGKQKRLKEILKDSKVSSSLRGEIKRDVNEIKKGKRKNIRVPKGYELAHRRGKEARNGFGYEESDLQVIKNHRTQHKIDKYGKRRKK